MFTIQVTDEIRAIGSFTFTVRVTGKRDATAERRSRSRSAERQPSPPVPGRLERSDAGRVDAEPRNVSR
jgi:hypothetical protein